MPAFTAYSITQVFTIADGETDSDVWGIAEFNKGSIQFPTMTGATVKFWVSNDGTNFVDLGTLTVATAALQAIPATVFVGKRLKIISASSEGADRLMTVLLKGSS